MKTESEELYAYDGECIAKAKELGKPGLIDIQPRLDSVVFRVESTGVLPAADIVGQAIDILYQKQARVFEALQKEQEQDG